MSEIILTSILRAPHSPDDLVAMTQLIAAAQEAANEIDRLRAEVDELNSEVNDLRARFC